MSQKKKYIILVSLSVFMIFVYIWSDLFVREQLDLKQKQLTFLNKELQAGKGVMDEIQSLRQKFIKDTDRLIAKKVTGNELLQEIDRLNTLANSLNIDLKNLEIDPRNTFPNMEDTFENKQINISRNSLNIELHGNFLDIGSFLETIESNSNQLKLQFCSIGLDSLDPRGVIAEIEYLTYGGLEL